MQKGQVVKEYIKTGSFEISESIRLRIAAASYSPARDLTKPTLPSFMTEKRVSIGLALSAAAAAGRAEERPVGTNARATAATERR